VLFRSVQACFEAGALATGCTADIRWARAGYLDMKTCWPIGEGYEANARCLGGDFFPLEKMPSGSAGSTDMGNVSHRVPSIHPMSASAPPSVVIHNPEFARWAGSEMGDKACIDGAKSLAMTAIDFMTNPAMQEAAKAGFAETAENSARSVGAAFNPEGSIALGGCGCC